MLYKYAVPQNFSMKTTNCIQPKALPYSTEFCTTLKDHYSVNDVTGPILEETFAWNNGGDLVTPNSLFQVDG